MRSEEFVNPRLVLVAVDAERQKLSAQLEENSFRTSLFTSLTNFQLYALSLDDEFAFARNLNPMASLNVLHAKSSEFWRGFIGQLFTDSCAVVVGLPTNCTAVRSDPWLQVGE